MDNQTRRILLERVKASGFPGSILDVFQNPAVLDQFIAEQQQSQLQQPQNIQVVAETPEQQRQGLRPYHNNNITNVEMAFPNVEANQSINTIGMKGNINVDVIKQGNLVQSFKAIPPGIANFPTGSPEGATLIESPAKGYQKGGFHQKIYTDPEEFRIANKAYNDSLDLSVEFPLPPKGYKIHPYEYSDTAGFVIGTDSEGNDIIEYRLNKRAPIEPIGYTKHLANKSGKNFNKTTGKYEKFFDTERPIYKAPTEEPVYQERPKGEYIKSKDGRFETSKLMPIRPTYMPPSNTMRVLRAIQEEDKSNKYMYPPRIVAAPEFKTGGVNKYQTGKFYLTEPRSTTDVKINPPVDFRNTNRLFENLDAAEKLKLREELDSIQSSPGSFKDYKRADQIMKEIKYKWPEDDSLTMTEDVRMQQLGKQLIQSPLPYDNITLGQEIKDATSEAIAAKKAQDQYIENLKKKTKQTGGTKTYLKGGLKNRVLYNKAKYKR